MKNAISYFQILFILISTTPGNFLAGSKFSIFLTIPGVRLKKRMSDDDCIGGESLSDEDNPQNHEKQFFFMSNPGIKLFGNGHSWGGNESLIAPVNVASYRKFGKWENRGEILRVHIGLESIEDLKLDLELAFKFLKS